MAFSKEISDRQLALLSDLAALEKAGMIETGHIRYTAEDLDGTLFVEILSPITTKGQNLLFEFHASGKTIIP